MAHLNLRATFLTDHTREAIDALEMRTNTTGRKLSSDERYIATTEETITFSFEVGFFYLRNLSQTAYVELGYATGVYRNRIYPLQSMLITLTASQTTLYLKANLTPVKILFRGWQR